MLKSMSEELQEIAKKRTRKEKIEALQELCVVKPQVLVFLRFALDMKLHWVLPSEDIPYNEHHGIDAEPRLYQLAYKLYMFVKEGEADIPLLQRKNLFIQALETCTPADAKLLHSIKNRTLGIKGLPDKIVIDAFPEYFPGQ